MTKPQSDFQNPGCYARELGGCSPKISREHYISKSVLLAAGENLAVAGLRFQPANTFQSFGVEAMTAKVLCENHNQALSPLDNEAAQFFTTLRQFDQDLLDSASSVTTETTIDGAKVERWMLKLLAGLVYGGLVKKSAALRREVPWLRVLFGFEDWPPGWGFHAVAPDGPLHAFDGLEVSTRDLGDELWAAEIGVAGFGFYLSLGTPEGMPSLYHRPSGITMRRADREAYKRLTFDWPTGAEIGYVEFTQAGQYDGPRPQDRGYKMG